jgi:hypothetical protein
MRIAFSLHLTLIALPAAGPHSSMHDASFVNVGAGDAKPVQEGWAAF